MACLASQKMLQRIGWCLMQDLQTFWRMAKTRFGSTVWALFLSFPHLFLQPDEVARMFSEDIREFYHAFCISPQRLRRNALAMEVRPQQVSHLRCFQPWMWKFEKLVPCLGTMAMGDCRAVTYGQTAHP